MVKDIRTDLRQGARHGTLGHCCMRLLNSEGVHWLPRGDAGSVGILMVDCCSLQYLGLRTTASDQA